MVQPLNLLKETPSQTAGPYVHIGLTANYAEINGVYPEDIGAAMLTDKTRGERIKISGRVIDGAGTPLRDAVIEIWQANADGLYNSPEEKRGNADENFLGFGRCACDLETGVYNFETIKPGPVPFIDGRLMAPHITFWVVARGINLGLHTRMYFGDEQEANTSDPMLSRIEQQVRVPTLIAERKGDTYHFDIHLQGDKETIFFDI